MTTTPVSLQDLRRKLYAKAKAEPHWRFWGLYVHVGKMETLRAGYAMAKENDGAPGSDGVTFAAIEEQGVEEFLEQIRDELTKRTYLPRRARKKEIPKEGSNKTRTLSIPSIRDRVVQGALKLIVEPILDATCATFLSRQRGGPDAGAGEDEHARRERWTTQWLHATLGLFSDYRTRLDLRKALSVV